mmetsp:Transcript_47487/g.141827  ORF Transcript_47487/g.141827 Transcript_47487/m.141827 type:complete len:90 (+) Transcript_47487:114-383(+)
MFARQLLQRWAPSAARAVLAAPSRAVRPIAGATSSTVKSAMADAAVTAFPVLCGIGWGLGAYLLYRSGEEMDLREDAGGLQEIYRRGLF